MLSSGIQGSHALRSACETHLRAPVPSCSSNFREARQGGWRCEGRSQPHLRQHRWAASSQQGGQEGSQKISTSEPSASAPDSKPAQSDAEQPSTSGRPATSNGTATNSASDPGSKQGWRFVDLLPPAAAVQLVKTSGQLLRSNFWAVVLVYMVKDGAAFLLHRVSQRMTNIVSDSLLGTTICTSANPWWLYLESSFLESNLGYQLCIVVFFLIALPLNILLSASAASAAALLTVPKHKRAALAATAAATATASSSQAPATGPTATNGAGTTNGTSSDESTLASSQSAVEKAVEDRLGSGAGASTSGDTAAAAGGAGAAAAAGAAKPAGAGVARPGLVASVRQGIKDVRAVMPEVAAILKRVWWVDCLFNMRALPLQALSLLVLPLPWTVPRLLSVQLSVHAAILEGHAGKVALERSSQLMSTSKELMAAYGWPFVALIVMVRLLDGLRNMMLATIPVRWWQDVVEVPLAVTAAFGFAKLLIIRLQDLLPLAAYLMAIHREGGSVGGDDEHGPITLPSPPTSVPTI